MHHIIKDNLRLAYVTSSTLWNDMFGNIKLMQVCKHKMNSELWTLLECHGKCFGETDSSQIVMNKLFIDSN